MDINPVGTIMLKFFHIGFSLSFISFLAIVSSACSQLAAANRQVEAKKPGVVRTPSALYRNGKDLIEIRSVNGQTPKLIGSAVAVTPGKHVFRVGAELRSKGETPAISEITKADTYIELQVESEHDYLIDAGEDQGGVQFWVTDQTTKKLIYGQPAATLPGN